MVMVTKADGEKQPFQKDKVIGTCLRLRASRDTAETIASKIENQIHDGISTKTILQMIFRYLKDYPAIKHQLDLRAAISLLRPKPDFEQFVQMLLDAQGYTLIAGNQIVRGKCVEHELDAIVRKDEKTYLVEIKHHRNPHIYTGLDIPRIAQATLEDLVDGFKANLNTINITNALIICNTKFSNHALQYANCKEIAHVGWKAPKQGLERMIEEMKFYPITMLKELSKKSIERLLDNQIILLKQLITCDTVKLRKKARIPKKKLEKAIKTATTIIQPS